MCMDVQVYKFVHNQNRMRFVFFFVKIAKVTKYFLLAIKKNVFLQFGK